MPPNVFIPDRDTRFYLLRQHRQPLAENVTRRQIEEFTAPGELVIDPFAASATTARVALEMGRRVIAVDSNPLVAFVARMQAALPPTREITNAVSRLGEIQKENESLREHLKGLYASVCANCGAANTVDYFVWSLELNAPVEKIYQCPTCGSRRDPTTDADRIRANEFKPRSLQYHLLLDRITGDNVAHNNRLRELLKLYTPRNLYALVTLTLKLDAEIPGGVAAREILIGCLIHALDVGTTLYSKPDAWPERKTPEQFIEMNIWHAFERASHGLIDQAPGVRLADSPGTVSTSATPVAFVGHSSARRLAEEVPHATARLILSSPARLDPTFWELSFLWTRWVFSQAAAAPLEPLLDETRQRWGWYGNALAASLRDAAQLLQRDGLVAFAFPAGSHAMVEALMLASAPIFELDGFSFRPHHGADSASEFGAMRGDYRLVWAPKDSKEGTNDAQVEDDTRGEREPASDDSQEDARASAKTARELRMQIRTSALHAATEILSARGEPLAYSWLHHNALEKLARGGILAETLTAKLRARDNAFQFLRRELEAGLKEGYARDFDHWKEAGRVLWMRRARLRGGVSLADRVDEATRELFLQTQKIAKEEFDDELLLRFPGLLTPEIELVQICAAAYAIDRDDAWVWREADTAEDFTRARELVGRLGERLNYRVRGSTDAYDLIWRDEKVVPGSSSGSVRETRVEEDSYAFIFRERIDLGELSRWSVAPLRAFVVIPETQVALIREKLRRAPTLSKAIQDAGWEFLRVPYVEMLLREAAPERAEYQLAWGLDPALGKEKEQMELF